MVYGKAGRDIMDRIFANIGARRGEVLVGPGRGRDNAVISLGGERVMVITTDPVSYMPQIGAKDSAWLSVHLIASDISTSGADPSLAAFSLNLPEVMGGDFSEYPLFLAEACDELGIAVVSGHTGSYPGAGLTVVGGGTMLGFTAKGKYLDPTMARVGDLVVMTKGAAIEATASLALSFPERTERLLGPREARKARGMLRDCTVVRDAKVAARAGLHEVVTSMHDATEGGVLGGLSEMADASSKAFMIDSESIPVSAPARGVCGAYGIDPLTSLSEGTLLLTCRPGGLRRLVGAFDSAGIRSSVIGRVRRGRGVRLSGIGGRWKTSVPGRDGYWDAYAAGEKNGWK